MSFFRYPGGKTKLSKFILPKINKFIEESGCQGYCEPFFGGGSIGFSLLSNTKIKNYYFNDIDISLICLYNSVKFYTNDLLVLINNYQPQVEDFFKFKEELINIKYYPEDKDKIINLGFKKLVIHQISFSGLGTKSGSPLGGLEQNSKYKIDCRWSLKNLNKKINNLSDLIQKKNVVFSNRDFSDFKIENCFFYFDPPYVFKGKELYQHYFEKQNHENLRKFINTLDKNWLLSYDDCEEIESLYKDCTIEKIDINYTINNSFKKKEVLIYKNDF